MWGRSIPDRQNIMYQGLEANNRLARSRNFREPVWLNVSECAGEIIQEATVGSGASKSCRAFKGLWLLLLVRQKAKVRC